MNIDLAIWLAGSLTLFLIGLYGLVSQKDAIRLIIAIEIMVTSANTAFVGIAYMLKVEYDPMGQTFALLSLAVGGAIIGLALSFIKASYEQNETANVDQWKELKW